MSGNRESMRMRDHNKGDLALAALTLSLAAAAAGDKVVRWVRGRPRGHRPATHRSPEALPEALPEAVGTATRPPASGPAG